jgi:hypothetical protein
MPQLRRLRKHLTYANVTATLALVAALAGGTTAIAGSKAAKDSVASSSIKPYNVTARDLAGIRQVQANGQFAAFAPCRRGERLIGGGGNAPAGDNLGVSRPGDNGWQVQQGSGPATHVIAYALCLRAKPGK